MSRISLLLTAAAAFGLAWPAAAQMTPTTPTSPTTPAAPSQSAAPSASSSSYTDAQLRNYAGARAAIEPLHIQVTSSMSATDRSRVSTVLQQHHLTVNQYTSIASAAQSDAALNARINGLAAPARPG